MIVTVRDYGTDAPVQGASVSVDGGPPSTTDGSGQATCPEGNTVTVPGAGTFVFSEPGDREIWMEGGPGGPGGPPSIGGGPTP